MSSHYYKPDVDFYGYIDTYSYEYFEADVYTKLDLDGNFGKALGGIYVAENDPKYAYDNKAGYDYGYKSYDKEGLDVVASELILDSYAVEGIGSTALTSATLLTDDHITSGLSTAEALGFTTFAETTIDIDVKDDYVNVGGLSASSADGKAAAAPKEHVFADDYYHYY